MSDSLSTTPEPPKLSEDEKILKEALERWKEADDADADDRALRNADVRFANGDSDNLAQWDPDMVAARRKPGKPPRPCITDNRIASGVRQVTNEQRQNKPAIKARPVDDTGDKDVAELIDGIIRHVEDVSDASTAYQKAGDYQTAGGVGYFRAVTEYCDSDSFDQEFKILPIPDPNNVRMDPFIATPEGSDQEYCFVFEDMPLRRFKDQHHDYQPESWDNPDAIGWVSAETVRVAEYMCIKRVPFTLARLVTGEIVRDPTPEVEEYIDEKRTAHEKQVHWYKLTAGAVLEHTRIEGEIIPVFRVVGEEWMIDGKRVTNGMTRKAKDQQRLVNYYTSTEAEVIAGQPKNPRIAAKGQIEAYQADWDNANTDAVAVLIYDPVVEPTTGQLVPPPIREVPPMMSQAFVAGKLGAIDAIKASQNVFDASLGQRSNETSGVAIRQRDLQSETSNYHYIDNLGKAVRQCGRYLVNAIPRVYTGKQVARIIGEDGQFSLAKLNWEQDKPLVTRQTEDGVEKSYNLSLGKYDVTVTVGPSFTTKRQEAGVFMTEALRADPTLSQKAGDIIYGNLDVPGADRLADRLRKFLPPQVLEDEDENQDPKIKLQQLRGVVQEMEQALQNADQITTKLQEETRQAQAEAQKAKGSVEAAQAKVEVDRDKMVLDQQGQVQKQEIERAKLELEAQKQQQEGQIEMARLALEQEKLQIERLKLRKEEEMAREEQVREEQETQEKEMGKQESEAIKQQLAQVEDILGQIVEKLSQPKPVEVVYDENNRITGVQVGEQMMRVQRVNGQVKGLH